MRGEKYSNPGDLVFDPGSPPHARGKGHIGQRDLPGEGITPACAGKRDYARRKEAITRDHPRMRGEKNPA